MRYAILGAFMALTMASRGQKITYPIREDLVVYGPAKSLIGVVRRWHPCYFYPIDTSYRKFINKYDRELLENPYRLDMFLKDQKLPWVRISDTTFIPKRN